MTPQKFKPGDKVGIINPNNVSTRVYNGFIEKRMETSNLEPNKEYTVAKYLYWEPAYEIWAVKLVENSVPVSESILAPLLPKGELEKLLEETLPILTKA